MRFVFIALDWLNLALPVVGLLVALWGARRARSKGFAVLAVYFSLLSFTTIASPRINRMLADRYNTLDDTIQQEMNVAIQDAIDAVLRRHNRETYTATQNTDIPIGPLLLIVGLWLLAKEERKSPNNELNPTTEGPPSVEG